MSKKIDLFLLSAFIFLLLSSLLISLSFRPRPAQANQSPQNCASDLIISEYIEGSSNNKALELYNGTSASIDLTGYSLELYSNGASTVNTTLNLSGTIASGATYVIANSQADAAVLAVANITSGITGYNGDDALVLKKSGSVLDSLGQVGFDPGTAWGSGDTAMNEHTLVRKATIVSGDMDPNNAYEPATEWDGYAQNTFSHLGTHTMSCGPVTPTATMSVTTTPITPTPAATATPANCSASATLISAIQGNGAVSPLVGSVVTIRGVVVGDFQNTTNQLKGFFVQEEAADQDADLNSSEGIFVYDNGFGVDVNVGDVVEVRGTVTEFFTLTELTTITQVSYCGGGSTPPASADLPITAATDWEKYEGMLVNFSQPLFVTEHYNVGRYGELSLSSGGRLYNPTQITAPGSAANAQATANDFNRILLDDGSRIQNPAVVPHLSADNTLRIGDSVTNLTAVIEYAFNSYRFHPVNTLSFTRTNPRPTTPPGTTGSLKVASANVLNYFTTLDTGASICGPSMNQGCRGANNASELTRQRTKLIASLTALNADIIGIMEIENNPTASIADLVAGLNGVAGSGVYNYIDTGTIGSDAIRVALIYKTTTVTPVGLYAILTSAFDADFIDTKNRPSLAQTFREISSNQTLTVVVNHLKSKGSACDDVGDVDAGDQQGNCNGTRTKAANVLASWLATDPTGSGDSDFLIIGDLNAYAMEDPITALKQAGYTDLAAHFHGATTPSSFVFDGESGTLDYGLASAALLAQASSADEWPINADEPRILDYNTEFNPAYLYQANQFRSSDHDPLLMSFNLTVPTVVEMHSSLTPNAPLHLIAYLCATLILAGMTSWLLVNRKR